MTRREKILFHQVHPLKLAADIVAAIISFYFFWRHQFWIGLLIHIAMPIVGSALVIQFANLDRIAASRLGCYLTKHMGALPQAARLFGDIVMSIGAWYHGVYTMFAGLVVIVLAWLNGIVAEGFRSKTNTESRP